MDTHRWASRLAIRRYRVALDMPRSRATWEAGWPCSMSRRALAIWLSLKVGRRPPRSRGGAAFGVEVVDAFAFDLEFHLREGGHDGEDHGSHGVSTLPPPRFRTRRFTFCARSSSARVACWRWSGRGDRGW